MDRKNERLNQITNAKFEGVMMLRSRSRYKDLGEKPTNYLFSTKKKGNYTSKVISRLVDDKVTEYNYTKEILNCQMTFYTSLYRTRKCIKTMKNNKTPGLDGFIMELFKFFDRYRTFCASFCELCI